MKVELDKRKIAKLNKAAIRAMKSTIGEVQRDVVSAQVMPFDTGAMQNTSTFTTTEVNGDQIESRLITDAPQARRLYKHPEYNFQKGKNPNAQGEWLEPWICGERKDFVLTTIAEQFKKEAGL